MTDTELIRLAMRLAGNITQQVLAQQLGVQPSAVSNWIRAKTIPEQSKQKLVQFIDQMQEGSFERLSKDVTQTVAAPPDRLRVDADRCGYWAESAWCFNYLEDAQDAEANATRDLVTRTFNDLKVLRPTMFRHYFRYQSFGPEAAKEECRGFGFLRDWTDHLKERTTVDRLILEYLGAHVELPRGRQGYGGYFVDAPDSVLCHVTDDKSYEFVGFKPECPVLSAHLVLSIPRSLRGYGPMVAYQISTDYPQYYDFAARIPKNRGDLERLIEPWGRPLAVEPLLPEQITPTPSAQLVPAKSTETPWSVGWEEKDKEEVERIIKQFAGDERREDREVYHVRVKFPQPLMTLLLFWPLPEAR